jgi:hypothetical protein
MPNPFGAYDLISVFVLIVTGLSLRGVLSDERTDLSLSDVAVSYTFSQHMQYICSICNFTFIRKT